MSLQTFEKKKDYLICCDSDGCAMDTMNIKHFNCFGPCMVEEWGLEQWKDAILDRWNVINLFSRSRGINRFKGLAIALREIDGQYKHIEGIEDLEKFVAESPELSNSAIEKAIAQKDSICLRKALAWSKALNAKINTLSMDDKKPFPGVKEALAYAQTFADVVIVSSANYQAVVDEWDYYHLLDHVDEILAQDAGSKAYCIAELLKKGYDPAKVMMCGDAPGDKSAALKNGVYYYPILVRKEAESWANFAAAADQLKAGTFGGAPQDALIAAFDDNLK